MEDKIKKFKEFLNERTYTENEINRANSKIIRDDMRRWNRLVKITKERFENIFK